MLLQVDWRGGGRPSCGCSEEGVEVSSRLILEEGGLIQKKEIIGFSLLLIASLNLYLPNSPLHLQFIDSGGSIPLLLYERSS